MLKKQCGQYQLFPEYIKIYCKSFSNQKVAFSKKVSPYIDGDNAEILDIKKQIIALYNEMRKWNKLFLKRSVRFVVNKIVRR